VDAVYLIHLDGQTARRASLDTRLEEKSVAVEVRAVPISDADPIVDDAWPFPQPILFSATDLRATTGGCAGNIASWIAVLEDAQKHGYGDIVICEDDVLWAKDFCKRYPAVEADLPKGWNFFCLGARVWGGTDAAKAVTERLIQAPNIAGTYAVGISADTAPKFQAFLTKTPGPSMGASIRQFIADSGSSVYVAYPPLCGHSAGTSTLAPGAVYPVDKWWPEAEL
jgi:GR25 family glycosyltransferase involved in LPS biosynthesis